MMETAALGLLTALLNNAGRISAALQAAAAEGRKLTPMEWQSILSANDDARARLVAAIEAAKAET